MAKHLARIHGTEEDKVNCPFYFKIGACRHADRCSRLHHKPAFSQTLLVSHLYQQSSSPAVVGSPMNNTNITNDPMHDPAVNDFLDFFEDMYMEFSKFGRIEGLYVADNLGDHLIGHVYVKFADEEEAADALQVMNGRFYDGRAMAVEYSPVTDFREARCRDFDEEACQRGGFCNFLHVKPVPPALLRSLEDDADLDRRREAEKQHRRDKEDRRDKKRKRKDRGDGDRSSSKRSSKHRGGSSSRRSRSASQSDREGSVGDDRRYSPSSSQGGGDRGN